MLSEIEYLKFCNHRPIFKIGSIFLDTIIKLVSFLTNLSKPWSDSKNIKNLILVSNVQRFCQTTTKCISSIKYKSTCYKIF